MIRIRLASLIAFLMVAVLLPACSDKAITQTSERAAPGYTLIAPMGSPNTYLIDLDGRIVHAWDTGGLPGNAAYLLENGNLLKTSFSGMMGNGVFGGGGAGGVVEECNWDGNRLWRFEYASERHLLHHDIEPLPNGNVLMIAWERKSRDEAIAAGRYPNAVADEGMWPDHVVEVEPVRPEDGRIVWEWHVWDHLVQDFDPEKPHYGPIDQRPERINVNSSNWVGELTAEQQEQLEALGYLGASPKSEHRHVHPDWNHVNAVAYNAQLDQIALSVLGFNEIWIIDHGTTTEEAAGSTGGRYGKGGDLLYRWGNPAASGNDGPQTLFAQHDVRWIPAGCPGEDHILVFNNGRGRPGGDHSSVEEFELPLTGSGDYQRDAQGCFAPARLAWSYEPTGKASFFSPNLSGALRLENGNTLICSGAQGRLFEISLANVIVWEYKLTGGGFMPGPAPEEMFKHFFKIMDTNSDGQLSFDEFTKLPSPEGAGGFGQGHVAPLENMFQELFESLDSDSDEQLTAGEFSKLPPPQGGGPRPQGGPPPGWSEGGGFGHGADPVHRGGPPPGGSGAPRMPGPPPPGQAEPGGPPGNQIFRVLRYPPDYAAFQAKTLQAGADLNETLSKTSVQSASPRSR